MSFRDVGVRNIHRSFRRYFPKPLDNAVKIEENLYIVELRVENGINA
jgi:hypothetical protein